MNKLHGHVNKVVLRASERLSALSHEKLVPLLERRIQEAADKGMEGTVFWHGKWWNYGQANTMLEYLRNMTPNA
jgi:hypothetical protein